MILRRNEIAEAMMTTAEAQADTIGPSPTVSVSVAEAMDVQPSVAFDQLTAILARGAVW